MAIGFLHALFAVCVGAGEGSSRHGEDGNGFLDEVIDLR